MKEGSPRYGEVFHVGDYLPDGSLFTGANHQEYRIAENRILLRMYENGELGGTIVTEDENGMLHIIVEQKIEWESHQWLSHSSFQKNTNPDILCHPLYDQTQVLRNTEFIRKKC